MMILNKEYNNALKRWTIVRDCVDDKVKERAIRGATCLTDSAKQHGYIIRDPNASDEGYAAFASRAVFKNYVGNTLDTLMGSMFFKPYTLTGLDGGDLPESIAYILEDFDGFGSGYLERLKERAREVAALGRYGVLVEFPNSAQGLTQAEIRRLGLQAQAHGYKAEEIKEWSTAIIKGSRQLNYVKLVKCYTEIKRIGNEFKRLEFEVTKEAFLDEDGIYTLIVDDGTTETTYQPRLGNGQTLDFIPFQFYGSQNNTPNVDISPLYKLAEINIGLYNYDASLRQNVWYFSCPTATFSLDDNIDAETFMKVNGLEKGQSPALGGTAYVGCTIELAQPSADNILLEAIKMDVEAMAQIGAQMITVGQNETAEAARIRKSSGMVTLNDVVDNIESGDRNILNWMMMFNNQSGQPDEIELMLNRQFYDDRMTPQEMQAKFAMVQAGKWPLQWFFNELKEQGSGVPSDAKYDDLKELTGDMGTEPINPDEGEPE